jgi:class 3 adenylate cyclase/tetratricopeptide (TPR) repeat protein
MPCGACGARNPVGSRFCNQCGAPQHALCPECGESVAPGSRFCNLCGARLAGDAVAAVHPVPASRGASNSEVRLVSVLFADLVGFTTLSEHRDPEEVRELLSDYFERCRAIIARYGGVVGKFIGDAVMAVWGTPVAREDDAERAVRAALALTAAVTALGEEVGVPGLRVRAGVLTGNAAVDVGAEREGMVLGDTVNTASRLQSIAAPGTVLVDDVTRRASEAAIAYADAGSHQVKGREQPVRAWTALRVVAGAGGSRRGVGIEAPLAGRSAELGAIIDAGERSAADRRAEIVAVVGEAGAGKSRLLWEFFKYLDGIQEVRWWHEGRCLSFGEGVAYWALAEMIRTRARILEEDPPAVAREKLRVAVELHIPDERERRLVEPRLAHLLRLEERPEADRADLFSGWRLFLERMAEQHPVILAFEDLQWADSGLLDFIDYLLDWSADHPIYVIALGRTELRDRRPAWKPVMLGPLGSDELRGILDGLVPGLPERLADEIVRRAEGIPLYAVETVRMLLDRGLLVQEGEQYRLAGEVDDLEVPETLHALVASRLDGLSPDERGLLQNASVLGQSFSPAVLAAVSERREEEIRPLLDGLVIKQILELDDDPISPERGQYAFLQAMLRTVAYGTLGRRRRKTLHLAAARQLRVTWPGEISDIAEVLAEHYLEAIRAEPDAADVGELRTHARETLTAAGRAAASLALGPEADRYLAQAGELAESDAERALLLEQAGGALRRSGDTELALERLRQAVELIRRDGDSTGGAAAVTLAEVLRHGGYASESLALLEPFRAADVAVGPIVQARALLSLGMNLLFDGRPDEANLVVERGLAVLEDEQDWFGLADGLTTRGVLLVNTRRPQEGLGILQRALQIAEERDLPEHALRARYNIAGLQLADHKLGECLAEVAEGLAVARERGDRSWDLALRGQAIYPLVALGRWDEALADAETIFDSDDLIGMAMCSLMLTSVAAARADARLLERCRAAAEANSEGENVDVRGTATVALGLRALIDGDPVAAADLARRGAELVYAGEVQAEAVRIRVEAAFATVDTAAMEELAGWVDGLPPARRLPLLLVACARVRGELAHLAGDAAAARGFEAQAEDILRDLGAKPLLSATLLDRVRRRGDADARDEAWRLLHELGATGWLTHLETPAVSTSPPPATSAPAPRAGARP